MNTHAQTVLFVDDEIMVLDSIERLFIDSRHRIVTTDNVDKALSLVEQGTVAVVVSDQRMPKMQGVEFLEKVTRSSPDTVKILLTGYADLSTAMKAINGGEVFRFIRKPWNSSDLIAMVEEGLVRFALCRSLTGADEAVLLALAETIELKDPLTQGHCKRVAHSACRMAETLKLSCDCIRHIRSGTWLHDCGKIGIPEAVLNYAGRLAAADFELIKNHSRWGAEVVRLAGMSPEVISIVLSHHERYDGTGYPGNMRGEEIPLEARIVTIADTYDALTNDLPYRENFTHAQAVDVLRQERGRALDPKLTDLFIALVETESDGAQ